MLHFSPSTPIYIVHGFVDFRAGLERLSGLCRGQFELDPLCGSVYVFKNKKADSLKILFYDGTGMWLCQKRLSKGKFKHWPCGEESFSVVQARELLVLLWAGDPKSAKFEKQWKPIVLP